MYKENLILDTNAPTRFRALEVARAEYQMEKAADASTSATTRSRAAPSQLDGRGVLRHHRAP